MTFTKRFSFAAIAVGLLLLGADDATETITAKGISFAIPKTWKAGEPSSAMRLAQIKVGPEKGDDEPAELVLFAFPGGGGSVEANLARWKTQFEGKDGKPPEITTDKRKGKNVDVTFAETSGRYVAAVKPGSPEKFDKTDWRLLGAIVQTDDTGYYFKLIGPEKTVKAAKPAFEAMIKSISTGK
jgi:hypothetical protein